MSSFTLDVRVLRSFVSVVETGSITETARRLGRTQPAITLQMQRLEELTGKALFKEDSRRPVVTDEGDMVLSYAKSILKLHDELLSRLSSPDIEGHVILSTPDLYAAYLLPSILALFRQSFPRIQVELRCSLSTPLVSLVQRGEVDIALVTRMRDFTGGQIVRQEQLIWMMGERYDIHRANPVPLALLPPGNVYRDYAIEGLERAGRKWRIACVSESVGGLQAAVFGRHGGHRPRQERARRRHASDRRKRIFSAAACGRSIVVSSTGHADRGRDRAARVPRALFA